MLRSSTLHPIFYLKKRIIKTFLSIALISSFIQGINYFYHDIGSLTQAFLHCIACMHFFFSHSLNYFSFKVRNYKVVSFVKKEWKLM